MLKNINRIRSQEKSTHSDKKYALSQPLHVFFLLFIVSSLFFFLVNHPYECGLSFGALLSS